MKIEEEVKIKDSTDRNGAYTMFVNAARCVYIDLFKHGNKDHEGIKKLEKAAKDEFDQFAQEAFNLGREYERNKKT